MGFPAVVKKVQNTSVIDCDLWLNSAIWHALKLDSLTARRTFFCGKACQSRCACKRCLSSRHHGELSPHAHFTIRAFSPGRERVDARLTGV
jgi:hypothetical protein